MKKTIILAILFILLVSCAQNENLDNYQTYDGADFSISYPSNWEFSIMEGGVFAFSSPQENTDDAFIENLNVFAFELSQGATLNDAINEGLVQLQQFLPEFNLISNKETTYLGMPAKELNYEAKAGESTLKFYQLATVKNNKLFTLTYVAEAQKYNNYLKQFEKMINSFKIK
ncbi:hypothetical protein COV11_02325 [Candidatus Woesearchaeota archaeon CG10_big_fil_rev_8_21_14_0_10_30_7]|nr:MAG: hypothetical protein COV11_02325 [Candidatus Woesearchaeota archaeon CG10_big_fil_rev_8_21_14_0_10_30_7]